MKVKIIYSGEYEDSIILENESIEELRKDVEIECKKRNWNTDYCHSEVIEE